MTMTKSVLNPEQQQAIEHGEGPLLIIAGAGTGKTTVITKRIEHLILEKKIPPESILALTFTEKAAREMEERVDVILPYGYSQLWIATYHSFCERILRDEAIHIGLDPSFKLIAEADAVLFLKKHLFQFEVEYFRPLGNPTKFLSALLQHFSRLKDEDISVEEYLQYAEKISNSKYSIPNNTNEKTEEDILEIQKIQELANAYKKYEELKIQESVMDFSDLISQTLTLFRKRKNVLKQYQEKFKYILVDEFQDTNFAQNQLAILISGDAKNITAVGDDDQAIYRWRGAATSNMVQFREHFKNTRIVTLTKNYRSSEEILNKSYEMIQNNNPDRLEIKEKVDKKLVSMRKLKGEPIEFLIENRVEDEAEKVIKKIQELTEDGVEYKDIAILVRANDHAQPFIREFERQNVPFQFLGPAKLFQKEEIRDLIAYLKVLYNFEDSTALYRVLCIPIFNIDSRNIAALLNLSRKRNLTLFESIEISIAQMDAKLQPELSFSNTGTENLKKVHELLKYHLSVVSTQTAGQILFNFLQKSGLYATFNNAKTEEEELVIQNIAKFFGKIKTLEATQPDSSVFAIVDWLDLSIQLGESPQASNTDWSDINAVNILTIHSSKGLEFPVVFITNLVTQRFPSRDKKEIIPIPQELIKELLPEGDYHIQEERRLFYVAMTRAKDKLFLTAAKFYGEGKRERKLSPFIYETLGKEYVEKLLSKKSEEKISVQESLLDWQQTETISKLPPTPHVLYPITYISYSQIQTFEFCPLHYKLKYILKIPVPQTASQTYGTSIHATLRDFYAKALLGKSTIEDISDMVKKNWSSEGYDSREHEKEAKIKAEKVVTDYITKNIGDKKPNTIAVETPFNFNLQKKDDSYIRVGGRIDRIDKLENNRIEIIDYKTGSNMPDEKELATNKQLTLYALAAMKVHDEILNKKPDEILLSLHFVEHDKKFTTSRTLEQLQEAERDILEKLDEISTSDFLCSHSTFCATCEYKMLCNTK